MSTSSLPNAQLEAFFMVPLGLISPTGESINKKHFFDILLKSYWNDVIEHKLDHISKKTKEAPDTSHYFHPYVQNFWFEHKNRDESKVRRFRHKFLHSLSIMPLHSKQKVKFEAACDLLYFQPDSIILALHVKSCETLSYALMLDCLNELRRLYPSSFMINKEEKREVSGNFPEEVELFDSHKRSLVKSTKDAFIENAHLPDKLKNREYGKPWAAHWRYLLQPIITFENNKSKYKGIQSGDDRAMVATLTQLDFSSIQIASNEPTSPHPITHLNEAAMTRLCFIDPGKFVDESPYSKSFLQQKGKDADGQSLFEKRYYYDRFWFKNGESALKPSRIMNCGYAFTWLGLLDDHSFFANEDNGAPKIFRSNYITMAMIAHFQQAKLLSLMKELSETIQGPSWDEKKLQQCQKHFIDFTQTYWFSEITNQEQGLELYAIWRRELRLDIIYKEVRDQLQDVMTQVQAQQSDELNRNIMFLTFASIFLTIISISLGLLGINTFTISQDAPGKSVIEIFNINLINRFVSIAFWLPIPMFLSIFTIYFRKKIFRFLINKLRR